MELYYQTGPALIKKIKERGHDIFLDLKLHDIPNTHQIDLKNQEHDPQNQNLKL
jgi:orotidine-5'-phosphate decarboxylase